MTAPQRVAAVDIGSNAIKARLVEIAPDAPRRILSEARYGVRLGESVFNEGRISDDALEAAVGALQEIGAMIRSFRINRTRVVATSATREAANRQEFVTAAQKIAGLRVEVITGAEEARLLSLGLRPDMKPGLHNLLVDIGGGSTEVVYTRTDAQVDAAHSIRLGAVRLASLVKTGSGDRISKKDLNLLRDEVSSVLEWSHLPVIARNTYAVGLAGTFGAILTSVHAGIPPAGNSFTAAELTTLIDEMRELTQDQIERRYAVDRRRAQILLPGAVIVAGIMDLYSLDKMAVSTRGLRDGVIEALAGAETLDQVEAGVAAAAIRIGDKYQFDRPHAEQVARIALALHDQLADLHRLPEHYRELLHCAALLHDIGQYIAYSKHHKHSHYLILNEELPGLSASELAVVAAIARYHRKAVPVETHPELLAVAPEDRSAVERCAAILRIADALDRQHRQLVKSLTADIRNGRVYVRVESKSPVSLELSSATAKAQMFEKVFGKGVTVDAGPLGTETETSKKPGR